MLDPLISSLDRAEFHNIDDKTCDDSDTKYRGQGNRKWEVRDYFIHNSLRACSIVSRIFDSLEEREDAT